MQRLYVGIIKTWFACRGRCMQRLYDGIKKSWFACRDVACNVSTMGIIKRG
jgi:hypothetical protein